MMIQIVRPKSLESKDEEETDNFDYAVAIIRYGMRLLGFWPQDRRFLCDLQCGAIFMLISFIIFPTAIQMYTVIYTVTDWKLVMHQALYAILIIPLLARFVFMKVMAKNFRLVLHMMIVDWANYRYLTKQGQRIMTYCAKKSRQFSILNIVFITLSIIGYILTPVMKMWHSDDLWNATIRILPHEELYSFHNKETPMYEILYVVQSLTAFFGATAFGTVDCFLYTIVFHVCGQFDILAVTLKQYNGSIRHHYTKDAHNCACLSCIVKRHVHILSYADLIERSFRNFLLLQLLGYWIHLILQGRELILHVRNSNIYNIFTIIMYMLTTMYFIFIYCYISECMIEKSENIRKVAHDLEWQHFPRDSNLPIIAARTRIPCKLTAGRFVTFSFPCFNMIVTTTISYISVLVALK